MEDAGVPANTVPAASSSCVIGTPQTDLPAYRRKVRVRPEPLQLDAASHAPSSTSIAWAPSRTPPLQCTRSVTVSAASPHHVVHATPRSPHTPVADLPADVGVPTFGGRVWFNSPLNSTVVVSPYAQVYGIHPRFFHFDASGAMQPTPKAEAGLLGSAGLAAAAWMLGQGTLGASPPSVCCEPARGIPCSPQVRRSRRDGKPALSAKKFASSPGRICALPYLPENQTTVHGLQQVAFQKAAFQINGHG